MKKVLKLAFHFLGSVHFAVSLIGITALFVVIGTLIESKTDSHSYAAFFTYKHPAFITLLWFFFVNILFAALRRYPFKFRHTPFLITHLGLLMILGGTILKEVHGVQGAMCLMEGSGCHELFLNDTYNVRIEKKISEGSSKRQLGDYDIFDGKSPFPELNTEVIAYSPNTREQVETWIKGSQGVISGLKPFPILNWKENAKPIPKSGMLKLFPEPHEPWNLFAFNTVDISTVVQEIFLEGTNIKITESITKDTLYEGPLRNILDSGIAWDSDRVTIDLNLNFSPISGFQNPKVMVRSNSCALEVPLEGEDALINRNLCTPFLGSPSLTVDLKRTPALTFIHDLYDDTYLIAFDPNGRVWSQPFRNDNLNSLIVYDEGFGGYAAMANIPFSPEEGDRQSKENHIFHLLENELNKGEQGDNVFAPPLKIFKKACLDTNVDFAGTFLDFLKAWDISNSWVIPPDFTLPSNVSKVVNQIDWSNIPLADKNACIWICHFFHEIDPLLRSGFNTRDILATKNWPLPIPPDIEDELTLLSYITQQLFSIGNLLPKTTEGMASSAGMLSAYMRAYEIHLREITPPYESIFPIKNSITLETPITLKLTNIPPIKKLEDNISRVTLKLKKGELEEFISLPYDRFGNGLRWPALNGEYLLRFQPKLLSIPFHVRLRQARQINYASSGQPYSYESDIIITDLRDGTISENTISMNRVHETQDGYRFYLANIIPPNETAVKKVQLIVNYDPGKYYLTYPGGVIMTLGIVLLFWYRKRKKVS